MILNSNRPWKPAPDDRYLAVIEGHLWVTGLRGEDHVLGPGQAMDIGGHGWVFQALGHCACEFVTSQNPPARPKVVPCLVPEIPTVESSTPPEPSKPSDWAATNLTSR